MGRRRSAGPSITLFSFQDIITSVTGIMILVTLMMAVELVKRRQQAAASPTVEREPAPVVAADQFQREVHELKARLESGRRSLGQASAFASGEIDQQARELSSLVIQLEQEAEVLRARTEKARRSREGAQQVATQRANDLRRAQERVAELEKLVEQVSSETRVVYNAVPGANKLAWLVELTATQIVVATIDKSENPQVFQGPAQQAAFQAWAAKRDKNREYFVLLVKPTSIEVFNQTRDSLEKLGFDIGYDLLAADQTVVDSGTGAVNR